MLWTFGHGDAVVPSGIAPRERAFCFVAIAVSFGPLGWPIQTTVMATGECEADTVFAGREAALRWQSSQPAKTWSGMRSH